MFYEKQSKEKQDSYKEMLEIVGQLSRLYSESETPYLYYRCHENIFCKYFEAENLSRGDDSADAQKDTIGVGLKTWVGQDDQKVAEFNKLKKTYDDLKGLELVKQIALYRNERIRVTKVSHGINEMLYHIVKRYPGLMKIMEHEFEEIDIEKIEIIRMPKSTENNVYFFDGKHRYHFNKSKSTLYMLFENLIELDSFKVNIIDDPYTFLKNIMKKESSVSKNIIDVTSIVETNKPQLCLRLYSTRGDEKFVPEKSGLNQWNAGGRQRNANELYIPYPAEDRNRNNDFFPQRDVAFELVLPDKTVISAKVCQDGGKAIMSNPNKVLGKWLLRKVFNLEEGTLVTYNLLEILDIDCVVFTKEADLKYSVDFAKIGTYEEMYE